MKIYIPWLIDVAPATEKTGWFMRLIPTGRDAYSNELIEVGHTGARWYCNFLFGLNRFFHVVFYCVRNRRPFVFGWTPWDRAFSLLCRAFRSPKKTTAA